MALDLFRDLIFQRYFLGWNRPLPVTAAELLVERHRDGSNLDLSPFLCVLPTAQSVLRISEQLVEKAQQHALELIPPAIITAGELPERLYSPDKPIAIDFEQTLAWSRVLQRQPAESLRPLMPTLPDSDSLAPWLEIAGTMRRLTTDLASHDVTFAQVLRHVETDAERCRWELLRVVFENYLDELARAGLADPFQQRRLAIAKGRIRYGRPIYLIGTSDLNESIARVVKEIDGEVIALVAAPESRDDDFDFLGRLKTEAFLDDELPIRDDQLISSGDIADQASLVSDLVSNLLVDHPPSQVTVGTTDDSQLVPVEIELADEDIPAYRHAGWTIAQTGPGRLIHLLTRFVSRPSWESLAAFVRHGDTHHWVQSHLPQFDEDFLCELDRMLADHFPIDLIDPLPSIAVGRYPVAVEVRRCVCDWLAPFLNPNLLTIDDEEAKDHPSGRKALSKPILKKPISDWCIALRAWLDSAYRNDVDRDHNGRQLTDGERQRTAQAFEKIHELLKRFADLNRRLDVKVTAPMALETIATRLSELRVGLERSSDDANAEVNLHGWLDLAHDVAPAMVVVGFNHPFVPGAVTNDPFLPGTLRSELRIADNERRYARDVYAMHLILNSRKQVRFVVGSNAADGSPTPPSRLLSAAPAEAIARRVRGLLGRRAPASESGFGAVTPLKHSNLPVPTVSEKECPIKAMSVTAFKAYLECPFRFYLRHVLGLKPLDDLASELAANQFGDLVHGALENFGRSPDHKESEREANL